MKTVRRIMWGVVLVAFGVLLSLDILKVIDFDIFFKGWWTLIIIVPSFIGLFSKTGKTASTVFLGIGVVLLLCCQGFLSFITILKLIIPALIILIGLILIFKSILGRKIAKEIKKLNQTKSGKEYSSVFSGQNINFDNEVFKGASLRSTFGGINCNLGKALITEDSVINCNAVFGGINIFVPANVTVKVKSSSVFGGVSNSVNTSKVENPKILYINASCVFGGVSVKPYYG